MSRGNICAKSCSKERINSPPRYVNVFKNVTSFPYYEKKYCSTGETSRKEDLLNKLKNLRPKTSGKFLIDEDCPTDYDLRRGVVSESSILQKKKKNFPCRERQKMNPENREKAPHRGAFYNPEKEVCEQLNESSRLSKKMHCNCYDHSQGNHYSKESFGKFPYAGRVTSLKAMSSCSSLDVSANRIKKQERKSPHKKCKKAPDRMRANRKSSKLPRASLLVNYSPESDFDSYDKRKKGDFKRSDKRDLSICQCPSRSSYSSNGDFCDENCNRWNSRKTNYCRADEEKVKSGYEDMDGCENYSDFEPRFFATPFKKNENRHSFEMKRQVEKFKKCPGYEKLKKLETPEDINFSDLTPDVPLPNHWSLCGQHMTDVTNEYRHLLKNFKSIQAMAENPHSRKSKKKFTRTYPSGKEFSFEVKPAKNCPGELDPPCTCKNCPPVLKSLKNAKLCKNGKGSVILDSYNTLVKSIANKKIDEKTTNRSQNQKSKFRSTSDYRNLPKKDMKFSKNWCDCDRKIEGKNVKKEAELKTKICCCKNHRSNSKEQVLRHRGQKIIFKDQKLNYKGQKLNYKDQEINYKDRELNSGDQKLNSKLRKNAENPELISNNDTCLEFSKTDKLKSKELKLKELNSKSQELTRLNFPRIIKPRGASCVVDYDKILIYPPHGEKGPPLTLHKKCSNIDCRIKGDVDRGLKYKVTYKQEFSSPVWHPEGKEGPFRKKENTKDYG